MKENREYIAEFIGTMILVIGGCGTAILAGAKVGWLGVSLAFGLSLLVIAYAIGHVSGGHVNPAVTIGLALTGKFEKSKALGYIFAQFLGGVFGAAILYFIAMSTPSFVMSPETFAVNGFGSLSPTGVGLWGALVAELVLTALFVFVVASTTDKKFPAGFGGITVGFALALVHLVLIPVTNASVNPARSFAVAIFAGGSALSQLWLFLLVPVLGGIIGAYVFKQLETTKA